MQVITRNNIEEPLKLDKITHRIEKLCYGLDFVIDPVKITLDIANQIKDKIKTRELDELSCLICLQQITTHPDFGIIAARIAINNHHKDNSLNFKEFIEKAYNNKDILGNSAPLISEELKKIVDEHGDQIVEWIDYDRDYNLNCFGFKTLVRAYLLKTIDAKYIEKPGDMFMRVSLGIHGWDNNGLDAKQTYDYMSNCYFTHATPTLFHAGTPYPQMSSCFLMGLEDSVTGIFEGLGDAAQISKHAGGIGIHIHDIRAKNSYIRKTAGLSNGLFPMLKVFNDTARYINQGGKRNGSFAIYLEPHHPDIFEFLESKKPQGSEDARARDLFYALWISDLFMKRVKEDSDWSLFCPDKCPGLSDVWGEEYEKLYLEYENKNLANKTIKARTLWEEIIASQIETGGPYMLYKDAVNKKSNQQNVGTIKSSNLCCVTGDTLILTDNGHIPISELAGNYANIWNGECFSRSEVFKTNDSADVIDIKFSDGMTVSCTKYHKFVIQEPTNVDQNKTIEVEAQNLKIGDKLIRCKYPVIDNKENVLKNAYTNGYFAALGEYVNLETSDYTDGNSKRKRVTNNTKEPCIFINTNINRWRRVNFPYNSQDFLEDFTIEQYKGSDVIILDSETTMPKDFIPKNYSLKSKLDWFAGYCDALGELDIKNGCQILKISSINQVFLVELKLFLQTCGINPIIVFNSYGNSSHFYYCLTLSSFDIHNLINMGLKFNSIDISGYMPTRNYVKSISVTNIFDTDTKAPTYCFNEPIKHMGIFNGIISHNCEITEYSDTKEYAVCNLASIALPKFVTNNGDNFDFEHLRKITKILVNNLNKVIDKNYYPLEKCKTSNLKHRPIGIGVQGLADVFIKMNLPFDSHGARLLNSHIFQHMYYAAIEASTELAEKDGSYSTFVNSPSSKGIFQFDMWDVTPENIGLDWEILRNKMKKGLRNSLLIAPMPTASTSQILGCNECIEPYTNNISTRRTLAGEFVIINEELIRRLIKLKMWTEKMKARIILNNGSIQNIKCIPEQLKDIFKNAWELKQKCILDMAADRGAYVCQSQSLNVFVKKPTFNILNSIHMYGHEKGLKTGTYYIRTQAATKAQNFTIDPELEKEILLDDEKDICEFCSA